MPELYISRYLKYLGWVRGLVIMLTNKVVLPYNPPNTYSNKVTMSFITFDAVDST